MVIVDKMQYVKQQKTVKKLEAELYSSYIIQYVYLG